MNMQALTPEDLLRVVTQAKMVDPRQRGRVRGLGICGVEISPKIFKSTVVMTIDSPRIAKEYVKGLGQAKGRTRRPNHHTAGHARTH